MSKFSNAIIIKIGGSYVTEKEGENGEPKLENIHLFSQTISNYLKQNPNQPIILAHGAGSFGHRPAAKYSLQNGFHPHGMTECGMAMQKLSFIICTSLQEVGLNVLPMHPCNLIITEKRRIKEFFTRPIEMMLEKGTIPVIHGDPVFDTEQGSCILSADQIVPELAKRFGCKRVGLISNSAVLDLEKNVIDEINSENYHEIEKCLGESKGIDVTGGMKGKINELMLYAKQCDMEAFVFDGNNDNLLKFLNGEHVGTKVSK